MQFKMLQRDSNTKKTAKAAGVLIGNKIVDKITEVSTSSPQISPGKSNVKQKICY